MKVFKYWTVAKGQVEIDGNVQVVTTYGGSNVSVEDAAVKAQEKMEKVKRKINGDRSAFDDYEVEIREEILRMIDDKTVITRNRYGAQVMNAESLMFIDIDKPKATFGGFFKKSSPAGDKQKIYEMVRKLAASSKYAGLAFRLYETFQGARVIVLGRGFDARDGTALDMMREFNSDALYVSICRKQGCFRARLTPKPYRMNMKAYKVQYPREIDAQFDSWLQQYESASRNFNTCRFVEQVGASHPVTEAVRVHDEMTGVHYRQPLA